MVRDTRRCFWFGTEERAGWFATPLQGADSSPSAWGVDGTLLNGGGYAFNSFGSHKRYTYEWPQSSSPETAQMMKSYRDGTYGRGLLYFLEPGIYRTNILPAHWADPSMSLNNEAPSLVYGVNPVPVRTSGGDDLGLPVVSAQYDLSDTPPQTVATPDSSVFIPIPEGHTLILGAFYSSTGTGGVFATPVNSNGTLGVTVRLTEKSNSDTDVLSPDQFSGDIRGIRLWVGRSALVSSSVTLVAMTARLLETRVALQYGSWENPRENLLLNARFNPSFGNWVPVSGSLWTGSTLNGRESGLVTVGSATNILVSDYLPGQAGAFYSTRVVLSASSPSSVGRQVRLSLYDGTSYISESVVTLGAVGVEVPVTTSTTSANANNTRIYLRRGAGVNTVQEGDVFSVTDGIQERGTSALVAGTWFWGNSPDSPTLRNSWSGAPVLTSSIQETRTVSGNPVKTEMLSRGPWIGGQGHSGCRFLGTPSYVTNSPIEGGRVGFSASFIEVGSWVYG